MSYTEKNNHITNTTTNSNNGGVVPSTTRDPGDIADVANENYYNSLEFLSVPMMMKSISSPRCQVVGGIDSVTPPMKNTLTDPANTEKLLSSPPVDASDPVRDDNNNSDLAWEWNVKELKPVPLYHPIGPTALTISSYQLPLKMITNRISNFMRLNSISCNYDHQHNTSGGRVDCLTQDLLQFTIQLWKGKTIGSTIVEMLHTQGGYQMEMQQLRGKLYHAIEAGIDDLDDTMMPNPGNNRDSALYNIMEQSGFDDSGVIFTSISETKTSEGSDVLGLCLAMLRSGQEEQIGQALKYLCLLSDPTKTSAGQVDRVSRIIVFGDENGDHAVKDVLWHYFAGIEVPRNDGSDDTGSWDGDSSSGMLQYAQGNVFGTMHLMGLRIISQALQSIAWQKKKSAISLPYLDFTSLFWKIVEEALLYNLNIAERRPLEAALSAKCIRLIQGLEPQVLGVPCGKTTLLPSLFNAHQFGRAHHRWLERESKYLIGRFGMAH